MRIHYLFCFFFHKTPHPRTTINALEPRIGHHTTAIEEDAHALQEDARRPRRSSRRGCEIRPRGYVGVVAEDVHREQRRGVHEEAR